MVGTVFDKALPTAPTCLDVWSSSGFSAGRHGKKRLGFYDQVPPESLDADVR
jgi:DUF438 domain-containing protein